MRIFLEFIHSQTSLHRCRLSYAFRVFCAVYGHEPVFNPEESQSSDVWISYSSDSTGPKASRVLRLGTLYSLRPLTDPAPVPTAFGDHGEQTVLFYAGSAGNQPDWLAEIFEWISCADEYSCQHDELRCVPFSRSYVGRHNLDVQTPYAAVAMRFLQLALCAIVPAADSAPVCPEQPAHHFVVPTHDVDYLPLSWLGSLRRLAKNVFVSLFVLKSPALAAKQSGCVVALALGGDNPLDQADKLAEREFKHGIGATFFFLTQREHRRDANYEITDAKVLGLMRRLTQQGMEIGVHGSYTSLDQPHRLPREFDDLRKQGFQPVGNRQHWLRFTLDRLIPAVEHSGVLYDTSLGWPDRIGFRGGACCAFPPYNFAQERPATFLEIPLAVMDFCLLNGKPDHASPYDRLADLLATSRRFGWGGISVLWHPNAFGGGQLPDTIDRAFWQMVEQKAQIQDRLLGAEVFVQKIRQRYEAAGLLPPNVVSPASPLENDKTREEPIQHAVRSERLSAV